MLALRTQKITLTSMKNFALKRVVFYFLRWTVLKLYRLFVGITLERLTVCVAIIPILIWLLEHIQIEVSIGFSLACPTHVPDYSRLGVDISGSCKTSDHNVLNFGGGVRWCAFTSTIHTGTPTFSAIVCVTHARCNDEYNLF